MAVAPVCPSCGASGKGVGAITLRSLLTAKGLAAAGDAEGYRHCPAATCEVSYFQPEAGVTIDKSDVTVCIGTKETSGPRPLCYCFGHSWESIEEDIRSTGMTSVADEITSRCRAGEDRCEETNPQGSCCLGNVRRAVKEIEQKLGASVKPDAMRAAAEVNSAVPDCCGTEKRPDGHPPRRAAFGTAPSMTTVRVGTSFAAMGAVIAAVLSSACCWLPLILVGLGAGASTVAGFFDEYRVWFLGGTAALLGAGFYLVYFRGEECAPGSACESPKQGVARFNKLLLWVSTIVVAGFALFPSYVDLLAGAMGNEQAEWGAQAAPAATVERVYLVEGMTCEGCAAGLKKALTSVPGVLSADVSYEQRSARVVIDASRSDDPAVAAAIESAGYRAVVKQE